MFKGWEPDVDICVSDMGGDDGLVSLCLDEADEVHEWGPNLLLLQIQRYVKKRVDGKISIVFISHNYKINTTFQTGCAAGCCRSRGPPDTGCRVGWCGR